MVEHAPCKGSVRAAALQCEIDLLRRVGTRFRRTRNAPLRETVEVGFEMGRHDESLSLILNFAETVPPIRQGDSLFCSSTFLGLWVFYVPVHHTMPRCGTPR